MPNVGWVWGGSSPKSMRHKLMFTHAALYSQTLQNTRPQKKQTYPLLLGIFFGGLFAPLER